MKLNLHNRQAKLRLRAAPIRKLALWLLERAGRPWGEVTLVLTDNDGITPVNRACFGKAQPTDVITVPFRPLPGESSDCSGEIFVNVERAREVAGRGTELAGEIALYIAHGIDHLSGETDRTPALRARMRRRELGWLRAARADRVWIPT